MSDVYRLRDKQSKVRQSLYRSGQALQVPGGWGSHISWRSTHEGSKLSALCIGCFYPQEMYLILSSVRGWVDPRATVRPEGLCWKIPVTPLGGDLLAGSTVHQPCYRMLPLSYKQSVKCDLCSYHFVTQKLWHGPYGNLLYADKVLWNSCQGVMPTSTGFPQVTQFSLTTNFIWMQYDLIFYFGSLLWRHKKLLLSEMEVKIGHLSAWMSEW